MIKDAKEWSEEVFGGCDFGDKRLTNRIITVGAQLSSHPGKSLSASSEGDEALLEGGYRLLRNKRVTAEKIAEGGYQSTVKQAESVPLLLAIEDTTSISYGHQVKESLGDVGGPETASKRGYLVHSTMLLDAQSEKSIGLIAQERWCRNMDERGRKHDRAKRAYKSKESYKWEKNSEAIKNRLGEKNKDVIAVCDREADIYEYLHYKILHEQRFIVRACRERRVSESTDELFKSSLNHAELLGEYEITVEQKGGRKKRKARLALKAMPVTILPPMKTKNKTLTALTLNVIIATEIGVSDKNGEKLEWILLTKEDVSNFEQARQVIRFYELRWRIEDFHKAWKSGMKVESQRMQTADNLEKMIVTLGFIAVRLLQLKEHLENTEPDKEQDNQETGCAAQLNETEWKVLWLTVEKRKIPNEIPSATWAYRAIAKLGGWTNSKRTGKAAWATLWQGWFRLQERVNGYLIAKDSIKM